jgi:class 3 adenylate cyclase/tetratricopeptide (TPR) repeat protein
VLLGNAVVDTAVQPLAEKRDRLLAASVGEQRKQVTVLFADMVDSTHAAAKLDPEDQQQVMSRYFAVLRAAVEAEGGAVEKFIGDAVMAVFGMYRAREDDAARAVRAALVMLKSLEQLSTQVEESLGVRLRMRIGIDTGEVVVTGLAEQTGGEFLVVGDTANRAARLQSAAAPGTVLLSAETAGQVRGSFGLRRVPALRLKGLDEPVDAYLVVGADREGFWPEGRGIEGVVTRTVGRSAEMRLLQDEFDDVVESGTTRIVTVIGEAGVGKSRLVHDFETWLAKLPTDVWVLRGRASPSTQDLPNALLRSVFAERLGIRVTDDPYRVRRRWVSGWAALRGAADSREGAAETVATWLGFPLGEEGRAAVGTTDPEAIRRRGSALAAQLIYHLAERAPVVILLEDLHWADSASLNALEALGDAPGGGPLLVITTARPALLEQRESWGEKGEAHTRVRLSPLSEQKVRELVGEILQRADVVPGDLLDLVVDTADGNPFYVEELVKWLVEAGVVDTTEDRWREQWQAVRRLRVPATLRGLLQARLDSLEVTERGLIGGAAVVGRVFWDQAVARLAPAIATPERDTALERLSVREVIFERPHSTISGSHEFSFRHALMRDVAYEGVLRTVRRAHHALAAQWLEEVIERSRRPDEHAATLAHHHEEAGAPVKAAHWYLRAAEHAAGTFASDDALRLLDRAGALVPGSERALWCDILLAREGLLDRMGRRDEQRSVLDELCAATDLDPGRRAQVRLAEARWLFFRGEYPDVPDVAEEAADLARQAGRADLEADALMHGGRSLAYLNEHETAKALLRRSLRGAQAIGEHRRAGEAFRLLGVVATNQGKNEEALRMLEEARAEQRLVNDREGEAMVTGQVGALLLQVGRLEEAWTVSQEALNEFRASGHRYREGVMLTNLARIAMELGRQDDAIEGALEALRLTEEIDDAEGVVASLQSLGDSYRLVGEFAAAREHLVRGLALSREHVLPYLTAHLLASMAAVDLDENHVDQALVHAAQARDASSEADVPHAGARADLLTGMAEQAAGDPSAVDHLRAAAQRYADLDVPADRLESLSVLAVALLGQGDLAGAMAVVEEILPQLDASVAPGIVQPGRVLTDVHQVLVAAGDPRAADVARRAASYLLERSARITDDELRARFLTTPTNTELARLASTNDR